MNKEPTKVFMDNITLLSLIYWLKQERPKAITRGDIWNFDRVSPAGRWGLKIFAALGYVNMQTRPAQYIWCHLRSADGAAVWDQVASNHLHQICVQLRGWELEHCRLLRRLSTSYFDRKRFLLYIRKWANPAVMQRVIPSNIIAHQFASGFLGGSNLRLFLGVNKWSDYLDEFGVEKKVALFFNPRLPNGVSQDFLRGVYFSLKRMPQLLCGALLRFGKRIRGGDPAGAVLWALVGSVAGDKSRFLYYMQYISALIFEFSFWYDFFKTQGIRTKVNYSEFVGFCSIGSTMASRYLGGVMFPIKAQIYMTPRLKLLLLQMPYFLIPLFLPACGTRRDCHQNTLFMPAIVLMVFSKEVVVRPQTQREELQAKGIEFILAYFYETFSHSHNAIISKGDASSRYALLLEKLLDDGKLGLVFKPKKPAISSSMFPVLCHYWKRRRLLGGC